MLNHPCHLTLFLVKIEKDFSTLQSWEWHLMHKTSSLFNLVIVVTITALLNVYSHIAVWCYTKQIDGLSDIAQNILVYEFWLYLCYFLLFLFYALLYCCIRCPVS